MKVIQVIILVFLTLFLCLCRMPEQRWKSVENFHGKTDTLPELKTIISDIECGGRVESSNIGFGGSPSLQWSRYERLKKIATIDQLVTLVESPNSVIRCYAFQALASKYSDKVFSILLNHLHDTSSVVTQCGCVVLNEYVGDYFINVVTPNHIETGIYKLTIEQREMLDSILINDDLIMLFAKNLVLQSIKPINENYGRIRELVEKDKNESALITLAKFRKQEDKKILATFFENEATQYSALKAAREFPDDYFYPYIMKIFETEWKQELFDYPKWRMCYQALAKYPRKETLEFFERTTNIKEEFRYNILCKYLLIAIIRYPDKLYDNYKQKIKLNEYYMNEVEKEVKEE